MARWPAVFIVSVLLLSTFAQVAAVVPINKYAQGFGAIQLGDYGYDLVYMTDFDGDGQMDFAISAPYDATAGTDAGAIYIFSGTPSQGMDISADAADMVILGQPGEALGASMDTGDFDGDGLSDIIVGAAKADSDTGHAYIFLGGQLSNRTSLEANSTFSGTWQGQGFGVSVTNAGNLNGDRFDDFVIGASNGNQVYVYEGRGHMETGTITLPEVPQDYPNPVEFTNGLNSTANTFGWLGDSDGWDWATGIYGGTNTDVHFAPVGGIDPYLKIVIGNQTTGNGGNSCPAGSGGYGVDFNLSQAYLDAIQDGADIRLKFDWYVQSRGLMWWQDEYYWVKARFWTNDTKINYLGSNQDGDNNPADDENNNARTDSTLELFYNTGSGGSTLSRFSNHEEWSVGQFLTGAHEYYFDVGGKLGDWSSTTQDFHVRVDNVSVITEFLPIATLMGREYTSGYGQVLANGGDINGDGLDDLLVGAPGQAETHVYFGSRQFAKDFELYAQFALPSQRDKNDTTDEQNTDDLKSDNGQQFAWPPGQGYYGVDRGQSMYISRWDIGRAKGELLWAYLYMQYFTDWGYNANGWVVWSLDGNNWQNTDLRITQTNNERDNFNDADGPYDLHSHGLKTLAELERLDLSFNNTAGGGGGGPRMAWFDFTLIYFVSQMPSNITIKGRANSELGQAVAGLGSINGDPYDDIVIGAPNSDSQTGAVYVFLGGKGLIGEVPYTDAFVAFTGDKYFDRCGHTVASAGLFSLDKFPDIAIGSGDALYVVRGGPRMEGGTLSEIAQYTMSAEDPNGAFPWAVVPIGDINNGYAGELLASDAAYSTGQDQEAGKAYILYNSDEDILKEPLLIDFYPKGDQTINEGENISFGVVVKAPEELSITFDWTLDGVPVAKGVKGFTYFTDYSSAGDHVVKVHIYDGYRTADVSWNVKVLDVNFPPDVKFYPAVDPKISEGDGVRFWTVAKDPDNDPLTYSWDMDGAPLSVHTSDYLLKSTYDMAGSHVLSISVSDGHFKVGHKWLLTVDDVNRPPVIDTASPVSDPTVVGGEKQPFNITAHDPDDDALTVVWKVDGQAVALDKMEYVLATEAGKTGTHTVIVSVSDGEYTVSHGWTLKVDKGNQAPIIDWVKPASPVLLDEGDEVVFFITAHDPDGDPIQSEWMLDGIRVIGNMSYDFRVPVGPKGEYSLKVTVSDGKLDTSYVWRIIVNRRPSIDDSWPLHGGQLSSGKSVTNGIKFHDPDKDPLTVTWYINDKFVRTEEVPSLAIASNSSLDMVAPFEKVTEINVKVVVSDGRLTAESKWRYNLTTLTNGPPVAVIGMDPSTPKKGKAVKFDASGSHDPEGDIVSFEWRFSDGYTATGKQVSRTFDQKAIITVTLVVTDSKGNTGEATKVLSLEQAKIQGSTESPWSLVVFILLLVIFVTLLLYQSYRKGWVRPKKEEDLDEPAPLEGDDRIRRPEEAPTRKGDDIEGPFEEVGDEEHGEVEELTMEDER